MSNCRAGLEQYCLAFPTFTYNGADKFLGGPTFGGYSTSIVVDEAFVLRVPAGTGSGRHRAAAVRRHHDLLAAAPLEGRAQPEGGHRRASADWGTWR